MFWASAYRSHYYMLIKYLGDYLLIEVLEGFRSDKKFQKAKTILLSFPCFDIGAKEMALQSVKNYRYLRKKKCNC